MTKLELKHIFVLTCKAGSTGGTGGGIPAHHPVLEDGLGVWSQGVDVPSGNPRQERGMTVGVRMCYGAEVRVWPLVRSLGGRSCWYCLEGTSVVGRAVRVAVAIAVPCTT